MLKKREPDTQRYVRLYGGAFQCTELGKEAVILE